MFLIPLRSDSFAPYGYATANLVNLDDFHLPKAGKIILELRTIQKTNPYRLIVVQIEGHYPAPIEIWRLDLSDFQRVADLNTPKK